MPPPTPDPSTKSLLLYERFEVAKSYEDSTFRLYPNKTNLVREKLVKTARLLRRHGCIILTIRSCTEYHKAHRLLLMGGAHNNENGDHWPGEQR
jgi:hypothetical protein